MARKADPSKVWGSAALKALDRAKVVSEAYTEYILIHYKATGTLAPGCDARDLIEWLKVNAPDQYKAKLFRPKPKPKSKSRRRQHVITSST